MHTTIDRLLDIKHNRRLQNEDKFIARIEKLEARAERLICELCRNGETVNYIYSDAHGIKYREGTRRALIDFLIRNKYVR